MKATYNRILILIALFSVQSCSESFLDVEPINQINSENFFNSEDDYQQALIGTYDLLASTYLNVIMGEIASDNTLCGGENANDVPGWQEIDDMRHNAANDQLRNLWNWMYAGINRANYIFEFQDKLDFNGKEQILGQAAFLRAYYYFELVKWFGDVPLAVDERVNFNDIASYPRARTSEVYAQIEADLAYAASVLPLRQDDAGRVTKGAAQSLLGKALVYQEKYAEAAPVLDEVINSGVYDLYTDFSTLFLQQGENNIESVFEVQYSNIQGAGFGCLQCSEGNVAVGFSGVRGYNGPIYQSGFSFNVPVQDLVDQYTPGDLRLAPTIFDIEAFQAAQAALGVEVTYSEGYEHTGYYNHKYIPRSGESFQDPNLTNATNYRAIRFADVLLLAAEAHRALDNDETALTYLNRVRARAGLAPVAAGGTALTDAILQERRLELAGEGHRFFDLVRTGRAADAIPNFTAGKNELFPIPLVEIELAGNIWEQNPGY
ncbi:RagB/SusD family nutrient uptake outer membrane protein [Flavilitoribacter nigricans]|uniref:RagB/SusD family nutrient uptake outer membrane protein n=1 Tax=Flavilitoribacter nigricans (strain ATCC 23147 / DSM 23189 / NBRC 102662 / NCIMB 1420 / SS-2) TaxID=1122177 RepID=A0A2D0NK08_FLAN2|nr:RagB/SusD family nutrient uptake outer membrane protein [Flavilitoribacter nigricans]PHN08706.1 RagB/SusD family nutrient uptake outer membrane protein [Flavilitoribacter nigricans DSM 23189 = NBRC 102662]